MQLSDNFKLWSDDKENNAGRHIAINAGTYESLFVTEKQRSQTSVGSSSCLQPRRRWQWTQRKYFPKTKLPNWTVVGKMGLNGQVDIQIKN